LALSAFLLLWINPLLVTNVGFQLSYIAVTGILLLYGPIGKLYKPKNPVLKFFWQLIAVSLAAQLATAPLAVFYFNQFPTFFLISNIFVIPAVTILVWGGVVLLLVGAVSTTIASIIGMGISLIINTVESILTLITNWPYASIQGISFDIYELLLVYLFIGLLIAITITGSRQSLRISLALVVLIFAFRTVMLTNTKASSKQIVFYSLSNHDWAVDLVRNGEFMTLSDTSLTENQIEYSIMPFRITEGLVTSDKKMSYRQIKDLGKVAVWQNKKMLIAESCAHHLQEAVIFDFILQPNHPRYMDCYSDQNLLIKLVKDDGYYGHSLNEQAFIAELN
jgi:competence protein ComEC